MSDDRPLTAEKLAFFGAISASLSHELKNVLATINEYSGLLDDLSHAARSGRKLEPERLEKICAKIGAQVGRGEKLLGGLNRFSHSVDEPRAKVDLVALVRDITTLCQRFASLRQVTLETRFPDAGQPVTTDPFACQHAIYLCIDMALAAASQARHLTVLLDTDGGPPRIIIESADPFERGLAPVRAELLDAVLSQCGARASWTAEPGRDRVALSFAGG